MSAVSAAPTGTWWYDDTLNAVIRAWLLVIFLICLGMMTLAAVQSLQVEQQRKCGPFIIGKSVIGGCDWLG
jgi:hypothetical protein